MVSDFKKAVALFDIERKKPAESVTQKLY